MCLTISCFRRKLPVYDMVVAVTGLDMARKKNMEADSDSDYEDFDYGEEPDFNDPDDFVDDITDEELMPEVMRQKPKETDGVESVIVVDGVPVVGGDRVDKLKNVIRKIYGKFGKLVNEHYPSEENGNTKGYIFLEVRYLLAKIFSQTLLLGNAFSYQDIQKDHIH